MHVVQIGELKNKLSAYLNRVRAGEELVVRDRKVAVAKIIPLRSEGLDLEEQALVAEGVMTPPQERFDPERFWAIGRGLRRQPGTAVAIDRAMDATREGVDVSILGRKRARPRVRSRSSKPAC
jgi:antitoxin (DNA-binding transcriptional repressor) of toxin-antitoxin stability system